MNDPTVEEVRRARTAIATRNGNDLRRIFEDARRRQGADQHPVVSYDPADAEASTCVVREEPPKPQT